MSPEIIGQFKDLFEKCGFIEEGQVASGLINSELAKERVTTYLRYRSLLKETNVNTDQWFLSHLYIFSLIYPNVKRL